MSDRLRNGHPNPGRYESQETSRSDQERWPSRLNVGILDRNARDVGPREEFDYAEAQSVDAWHTVMTLDRFDLC